MGKWGTRFKIAGWKLGMDAHQFGLFDNRKLEEAKRIEGEHQAITKTGFIVTMGK